MTDVAFGGGGSPAPGGGTEVTIVDVPEDSSTPGMNGQIAADSQFFYVYVDSVSMWLRTPLEGF